MNRETGVYFDGKQWRHSDVPLTFDVNGLTLDDLRRLGVTSITLVGDPILGPLDASTDSDPKSPMT